jgi:hypothetical protein
MYGEMQEWSTYHHLTIELHTSKKDEEGASANREKAVGEVGDEILTWRQFLPRAPNPFHEISRLSNAKWLSTAHNQFLLALLVGS